MLGSARTLSICWPGVIRTLRTAASASASVTVCPATCTLRPSRLRQQAAQVWRDDVDYVLRKRLTLANRDTVTDGLLDPIFVAPALLRDRARKRRREVFDLLTHRALDVLTALLHRMSRSDRGAGSHGGNVRRFGNEGAGGRGAGARRRDVHDHWQWSGEDCLDDLFRGIEQSARRVELDHQSACTFGICRCERILDVRRDGRIDRAVNRDQFNPRRMRCGFRGRVSGKDSPRCGRSDCDRDRHCGDNDEISLTRTAHDAEPPRRGIGIPRNFITS